MRKVNGIKIFDTFDEFYKYCERLLPDFFRVRMGKPFATQEEEKKDIDE